jgi:hypothetical protein
VKETKNIQKNAKNVIQNETSLFCLFILVAEIMEVVENATCYRLIPFCSSLVILDGNDVLLVTP